MISYESTGSSSRERPSSVRRRPAAALWHGSTTDSSTFGCDSSCAMAARELASRSCGGRQRDSDLAAAYWAVAAVSATPATTAAICCALSWKNATSTISTARAASEITYARDRMAMWKYVEQPYERQCRHRHAQHRHQVGSRCVAVVESEVDDELSEWDEDHESRRERARHPPGGSFAASARRSPLRSRAAT